MKSASSAEHSIGPDAASKPGQRLPAALKGLVAPAVGLLAALKGLPGALKGLPGALKGASAPLKGLSAALSGLPIPKKLVIPALAAVVLLIAGGVAFGLLHVRGAHGAAAAAKAAGPAALASPEAPSTACSGVIRDIYRQTVEEDSSVTLAEVRSEVLGSGISCAPDPEIAVQLKDLSPACRDMVQYTFLSARDGHINIKVADVREKVVQKSVACEHDRPPSIAPDERHDRK